MTKLDYDLKPKIHLQLIKNRGKLGLTAQACNIRLAMLKEILLQDSELESLAKEMQLEYEEIVLDKAELLLEETMEQTSRGYANAVKICLFVLTHKGAERGYNKSGTLGSQAVNKFELLDSLLTTEPGTNEDPNGE